MSDDGTADSLPPKYSDVVGDNTEQDPVDDGQQPPPPPGDDEGEDAAPAGGDAPAGVDAPVAPGSEHINIKVTDGNNEVYFKIKRSTQLRKLMDVFCQRQGKDARAVRFLFDGQRVQPDDDPLTLDMEDGDSLEVHQEQIGGA